MNADKNLLVFRFSAMGDVAMSASIIREFCQQNPDVQIIMVSRGFFKPFFAHIPQVTFHTLQSDGKHQGIPGLYSLYKELRQYKPIAIVDLHNNLRSNILSFFFKTFSQVKSIRIDKGRTEKKQLTQKENKLFKRLRPTTERYADVFRKLGFPFMLDHRLPIAGTSANEPLKQYLDHHEAIIGISPFAKHREKVYPREKMEEVVSALDKQGYRLLVFGGGAEEKAIADSWEEKFKNTVSLIGKVQLEEELQLIAGLDLMLSMDSSGMHMASLMGTPCVSIWGATHPYAGFLGYGQSEKDCIQIDLYCRPCSVFGNKVCYRGDFACMNGIDSGMIVEHIIEKINNGKTSFSDSTR